MYVRLHTRRVTGRSCLLPPAPWLQPHGCLQEPAEFTPYTEHTWVSVSRQVQNGAWHWGGTGGMVPCATSAASREFPHECFVKFPGSEVCCWAPSDLASVFPSLTRARYPPTNVEIPDGENWLGVCTALLRMKNTDELSCIISCELCHCS